MNLANKSLCIFGLKGSGKSTLMNYLLDSFPSHLVVTPHKEDYQGRNRYIPTHKQYSGAAIEEINLLINKVVKPRRIKCFAIDEVGTWTPSRHMLPSGILDLCDSSRHYGMTFAVIDRRPTKINTNLVETANILIFFKLTGKNDYQYLESLNVGLGDTVRNLQPYQFVVVDEFRRYQIMKPIRKL